MSTAAGELHLMKKINLPDSGAGIQLNSAGKNEKV